MTITSKISIAMAMLHSIAVYCIVTLILNGNEPDWPIYWYIFIPFDLPALAVGYIPVPFLDKLFENLASHHPSSSPLSDPINFWYPAYVFGFLGAIQWLVIPWLTGKLVNKIKKKANRHYQKSP